MKYALFLAALVFSTSVFASKDYGSRALDVVNKNNNVNLNKNYNSNYNRNSNRSNTDVNVSGDLHRTIPHQAPSFGIGTMFPTAPCQGTKGGGFSVPWGGAALSGSHTLRECEIRETIRTVIHMNQAGINTGDAARELLCMTEHGSNTSFCPKAETKIADPSDPFKPERKVTFGDMFSW